jgi:hypothetical protein
MKKLFVELFVEDVKKRKILVCDFNIYFITKYVSPKKSLI